MIGKTKSFGLLLILFGCALGLAGCSSLNAPASASFASVKITDRTAKQICDTTTAVFRENGYAGSAVDAKHLVFTREGSRMETIAYDGVVAAQEGASTLVRVRVELVDLGSGVYRVQCQTHMVIRAGQTFEEEVRVSNLRSKPYQKLLDDIRLRLTVPSASI